MSRAFRVLVLAILLVPAVRPAAAADAPQWLIDAAARALPQLPPETEAVVLLEKQEIKVSPDGTLSAACRRAIREVERSAWVPSLVWRSSQISTRSVK